MTLALLCSPRAARTMFRSLYTMQIPSVTFSADLQDRAGKSGAYDPLTHFEERAASVIILIADTVLDFKLLQCDVSAFPLPLECSLRARTDRVQSWYILLACATLWNTIKHKPVSLSTRGSRHPAVQCQHHFRIAYVHVAFRWSPHQLSQCSAQSSSHLRPLTASYRAQSFRRAR